MITEAIMRLVGGFTSAVLGLIPDSLGVPSWLDVGMGALMDVLSSAASLAVWIPLPLVVAGIGFRLLVILGTISVKSLRVVVSLFTGGGGSAA